MATYDPDAEFEDEDIVLPPRLNVDDSHIVARINSLANSNGNNVITPIHIDEEVVVKAKRKPAVKLLDRHPPFSPATKQYRLLSDRGLKHLRVDAPKHLKFKGKGHEVCNDLRGRLI